MQTIEDMQWDICEYEREIAVLKSLVIDKEEKIKQLTKIRRKRV